MFSVIIPVLNNRNYTKDLLIDIRDNIQKPEEIFIIDDNSVEDIKSLVDEFSDLKIKYLKNDKTRGFNYACNEGIKLSTQNYISFLNNDIRINKYFFKKIKDAFLFNETIGIVCPETIKDLNRVYESKDEKIILKNIGKREGWAYTIRASIAKNIHPIPSFLRIYCGDDYMFYWVRRLGYLCIKITNNLIFHFGGKTVGITPSCVGLIEKEKSKFAEYISSLNKKE
jgi:GT2 family glycosyltransferase